MTLYYPYRDVICEDLGYLAPPCSYEAILVEFCYLKFYMVQRYYAIMTKSKMSLIIAHLGFLRQR